jgi:hypothetical protein
MARSFQQPIEACLECVRSRKDRAELGVALFHAFSIPLAFLFFRMPVGDRGIGSLLPTLYAAFAAYAWTAVPIHELGHALAAMLTGYRVRAIYFGLKHVAAIPIGSMRLLVGPYWGQGLVLSRWPLDTPPPVWRFILMIAAGPLANVGAAGVAVWLLPRSLSPAANFFPFVFAYTFAAFHGLTAGRALFGRGFAVNNRLLPSDGRQIVARLKAPAPSPDAWRVAGGVQSVQESVGGGALAAARETLDRFRAAFPADPALLIQDVCLATWERRWARVQALVRPELGNDNRLFRNTLAGWLIVANLHTGAEADAAEAAALLADVTQMFKNDAPTAVLEAFVGWHEGRNGDAVRSLAAAAQLPAYPLLEAIVQLTLARVHDDLGSPVLADRHRKRAKAVDPAGVITTAHLPLPPAEATTPTVRVAAAGI